MRQARRCVHVLGVLRPLLAGNSIFGGGGLFCIGFDFAVKTLGWILLIGLVSAVSYLLGLVWPPEQVVSALFGRADIAVLGADMLSWLSLRLQSWWGWGETAFLALPLAVQFAAGFLFLCVLVWALWYFSIFTLIIYGAWVGLKGIGWCFVSFWEWISGLFSFD